MDELFAKATEGVDLSAPGAAWQILHNLMALVPWWELFWFTVACTVVGVALGAWRGRPWFGLVTGLLLGPVGWLLVLARPRRVRHPGQGAYPPVV